MFRPQSISSTEARKYFSQIINKVQFSSKSFVVQSYRRPAVRIVKEEYIAILEQVLGKKTVAQILQVSGNDNMREAAKAQEIRKILQRRLSREQQPQPLPKRQPASGRQPQQQPKPATPAGNASLAGGHASSKPQPKPQPQPKNQAPPTSNRSRGVLLLSNGKNYQ